MKSTKKEFVDLNECLIIELVAVCPLVLQLYGNYIILDREFSYILLVYNRFIIVISFCFIFIVTKIESVQ